MLLEELTLDRTVLFRTLLLSTSKRKLTRKTNILTEINRLTFCSLSRIENISIINMKTNKTIAHGGSRQQSTEFITTDRDTCEIKSYSISKAIAKYK